MTENTQDKITNAILVFTAVLLVFLLTCIAILTFAPYSSTSHAIETAVLALTGGL